jgi:hypothetical protein
MRKVRYQTGRTRRIKKKRRLPNLVKNDNRKEKAKTKQQTPLTQPTIHMPCFLGQCMRFLFSITDCPSLASIVGRHILPCLAQPNPARPLPSPLQVLKQIPSLFHSRASMVVVHVKSSQSW